MTTSEMMPEVPCRLAAFAADIKLSHTVFAMPWALLSAFLAARGWPRVGILGLILACMVTARTVAMAANRLLDAELDAANPRTRGRAIPAGRLSRGFYRGMLAGCAAAFVAATSGFWLQYGNIWPLVLAVPVLAFICAYPLLKRFTSLCHYYLGAALALAPVCAWVAVSGSIAWPPVLMAGAVLLWTAGFDIIYATQDFASDERTGVCSAPRALGIGGALWAARGTHLGCVVLLAALGLATERLGLLYWIAVGLAAALLVFQHAIVRPTNLSRVNLAFFTANGIISVAIGTLGILDVFH